MMQNMSHGHFDERDRLQYYPFTYLENVIIDRSDLLGTGAFGSVYKMNMIDDSIPSSSSDLAINFSTHPVAVKILRYLDGGAIAREITTLTLLHHPNLIYFDLLEMKNVF